MTRDPWRALVRWAAPEPREAAPEPRAVAGGPRAAVESAAPGSGGWSIAVKDNIAVAGWPTRAGSPALPDTPAVADAPVVAALRRAGAVLVGSANMHELALGVTSDNPTTGRVDNPVLPGHLAGGSSGGSAAAVAAGLATAALGTDTGGSVRIPAAFCGLAALRPTPGRYPTGGVIALSVTLDTVGILAARVGELDRLDAALVGRSPGARAPLGLPGVRIVVPRRYFYDELDSTVDATIAGALDRLRDAGCTLVESDVDDVATLVPAAHEAIALTEIAAALDARELADRVASPDVRDLLRELAGAGVPSRAAYRRARDVLRPRLAAAYGDLFRRTGAVAVAVPCVPIPPPRARPDASATQSRDLFGPLTRNPLAASVAGLPSLCLPAARSGGPPVGLLLDGPPGTDATLLRLGLAVESVLA